ncbi:histidinol dehydrogenase [Vallitalea pronyensis]|uniref:Histidinol dehydrogenase n=1 Tax=Vallitalea pronyensis TaxID=1348613 RepID=A0A8J8MKP8_9FIRM|nr:histidinol dehydrogenase [Vallitalea pronyensis]QUI23301.1 histidinol dehydrogenase [Vallitalea pronyensis]
MRLKYIRYNSCSDNELQELLQDRAPDQYQEYNKTVLDIIDNVKINGDNAVCQYTEKFDGAIIDSNTLQVTQDEIDSAYTQIDEELVGIIRKAKVRIEAYHTKQKQQSWFDSCETGSIMGQKITPIDVVGVYVPGGKAVYPSSVIMNIIPAKVAGVETITMTTPPDKNGLVNPLTLVAARECGVDAIYKVGGAQAIAALAFGTETIPQVDKIVGPGNIFVALAKKAVYGHVSIDSVAGPSEVLVIADETANAKYVAADLLSQAEHDELASSVLITNSEVLVEAVQKEIERQTDYLSRQTIINKSLDDYGAIILVNNMEEAIYLSNRIAPEHLEICTKEPFMLLPKIKHAGAIFLGAYSPEPLGDYMAGPNHVLPTNGTAKFFSPLSVDDFIKKSSIISFSREALSTLENDIVKFAEAEELTAHANAIKVRFEND